MPAPGPNATDELTFTLSEGITLSVAEAAPYGATLTEEFGVGGEDTGTLAEATTLAATLVDTDSGEITAPAGLPVYANAVYWTGADTGTLTDTAAATGAGPSGDGADTGTLSEGITLTVGETAAYGATLTETSALAVPDTETLTVTDTGVAVSDDLPLGSDTFTLTDNGVVIEGGTPSDAFTFTNSLVEQTVDDLVAEGTLTDAVGSITVTTGHSDTAALADNGVVVSNITTYATSGTDALTIAETTTLTVPVVVADTGTVAEGQSALALTHTDTATLAESVAVSDTLRAGTDVGTLAESSALIKSGGVLTVSIAGSDAALTLTDTGLAAISSLVVSGTDTITLTDTAVEGEPFYGKPLGTVDVATRMDASVRVRRLALATSDIP